MNRLAGIYCLLMCLACAAHAQQGGGGRQKYVLVPPEVGLATVAWQPECPVQFEDMRLLANVEGGGSVAFRLRNRGSKPIRSVTYEYLTTASIGWTQAWPGKVTDEVVMPGQLIPLGGDDKYEIVPLTEELRDKLKLRGPMRGVAIFMVAKVIFADGTAYNAEPTARALRAYVAKLAGFDYEDEESEHPEKQ